MSNESKHCPFCGSAIEKGSVFCQNCGASITGVEETTPAPQPYQAPQPQSQYQYGTDAYQQPATVYVPAPRKDDSLATLSLIMGILGCVCLPGVFSLIAVITGHIAYGRSKSPMALIGMIIGYIVLVLALVWLVVYLIIFSGMY
ncbi:MAG: zinc-ribbon domain-containing protein [Candidatus Heimdallarchaeota archaeon]